jgi:hypothetical protein
MPINISGTTAAVTGLVNGTTYRFRVAARNAVGTGPFTDPTTPGTPTGSPPPPTTPPPGDSWTSASIGTLGGDPHLAYLNNRFVMAPDFAFQGGPTLAAQYGNPRHSTDGLTWTQGSGWVDLIAPPGGGLLALPWQPEAWAYGNNLYVATAGVGEATGSATQKWGVSSNGTSWSQVNRPSQDTGGAVHSVVYDGYRFIATAEAQVTLPPNAPSVPRLNLLSTNGTSWSVGTGGTPGLVAVGAGVGLYIDTPTRTLKAGTIISGSQTPSSFTQLNIPRSSTPVYGPTGWIAPTEGSTYYTSSNGTTWTQRTLPPGLAIRRLERGAGLKYALAHNGSWWMATVFDIAAGPFSSSRTIIRSQDGIDWEVATSLPANAVWNELACGGGVFVAGGTSLTGRLIAVTS